MLHVCVPSLFAQQPPVNDAFANAIQVGPAVPLEVQTSNVDATLENGEVQPVAGDDKAESSVWFVWRPDSSGLVTIDTFESDDFDTVLAVWTGSDVTNLTEIASNDQAGGGGQSRVVIDAQSGQAYHIAVYGYDGEEGQIRLSIRPQARPVNDNFAQAQIIPAAPSNPTAGSNLGATLEVGEEPPSATTAAESSIWFSWTPATSGPVAIDTFGSDFDTVLAVWTGSWNDLTEVASNDQAPGQPPGPLRNNSHVDINAEADTTYYLAVYGYERDQGDVQLSIRSQEPATPPSNDNFTEAQPVDGALPIRIAGSNEAATMEAGEPRPKTATNVVGKSVWYAWTPDADEKVVVSTTGSRLDAVLAIWSGEQLGSLTEIASTVFDNPVVFDVQADQTYYIAVYGHFSDEGDLQLTIQPAPETFSIQVAGSEVTVERWGTGPRAVIFFGYAPFDMEYNLKRRYLSQFADLLGDTYSMFLWTYPENANPYSQVDDLLASYFAAAESEPPGDLDAVLANRPNLAGQASSVVNQIRTKTGLTDICLVGNSFGAGVILWDLAALANDVNLRFVLISPTELFMPANLNQLPTSTPLPRTVLVSDAQNDEFFVNQIARDYIGTRVNGPMPPDYDPDWDDPHFIIGRYPATLDYVFSLVGLATGSPAGAPVVTSATTASGQAGQAFTYQIAASNNPTGFNATGLPAGLTLNPSTGLISGTPTAAGSSTVTISATNSGGTGSATLTLSIAAPDSPTPPPTQPPSTPPPSNPPPADVAPAPDVTPPLAPFVRSRPTTKKTNYQLSADLIDDTGVTRVEIRYRAPKSKRWIRRSLPATAGQSSWSTGLRLNRKGIWQIEIQSFDEAGNPSPKQMLRVRRR